MTFGADKLSRLSGGCQVLTLAAMAVNIPDPMQHAVDVAIFLGQEAILKVSQQYARR